MIVPVARLRRGAAALSSTTGRLRLVVRLLHELGRRRGHVQDILTKRPVRHVVHVSPTFFDPTSILGGGERYVTALAGSMAELVQTTLITFGERRRKFRLGKLDVEVYPARVLSEHQRWDPIAYAFLPMLRRADVVHCHQYWTAVTALSVLACAAMRTRVFVTDYGGVGSDFTQVVPLSEFVSGFLPVSEFSAALLPRARPRRTILGGVDEEIFRPDGAQRGESVLFVGRILPHKGIDVLVRALPADVSLDVIGQVYDEAYYRLLQQVASGKRVRFWPSANDADIAAAYRQALVTVLPSVYVDVYGTARHMPELLGLVLLESMACGTPVICTAVGGMPEIVEDGVTGFVVPPNDSTVLRDRILRLRDDRELRRRMGQTAAARVATRFRWRDVALRCLEAYGRLGEST